MIENYLYILNDQNQAIPASSIEEWVAFFESDRRFVAAHEIDGFLISTVFLSTVHGSEENPQLFETMVFDHEGSPMRIGRYLVWDEAVEGHHKILLEFRRESANNMETAAAIMDRLMKKLSAESRE